MTNKRTARDMTRKAEIPAACRAASTGTVEGTAMFIAEKDEAKLNHIGGYLVITQVRGGKEVRVFLNYPQAMKLVGHIEALENVEDAWRGASQK